MSVNEEKDFRVCESFGERSDGPADDDWRWIDWCRSAGDRQEVVSQASWHHGYVKTT